ncbi:MAG: histidine phosphatase family protein [Solirubrobacterales bacterium]|nr:histidine phosphatase family protein [Solirubrobacterales bacterium]
MTDREEYPQRRFALPPDATEVVLVRHGASQAAVPGEPFELLEGHADPPLSDEGRRQAALVGERLSAERLDGVFVTPLQRTRQTAEPLVARNGHEPVVVPELREVRLGEWEGGEMRIRARQGDPMFLRIIQEERWDVIPGAEPMDEFGARVAAGLESIVAQAGAGARVAAFVHGGVIGEICRQVTRSRPFAFVHADNCSITSVVAFAEGHRLLRSFNDTSHLGEAPAVAG